MDPTGDQSLALALQRILTDAKLRRKLQTAGLKRARTYSWKHTIEVAAEALRGI